MLAFWVGPRIWREASEHGFLTVGDFLEHHFGRGVRGLAALFIWLGSFVILCGQLRGAAEVLQRAAGLSLETGAVVAAVITAAYFVAGGLVSAARVNVIQLVVILVGFLLAAPYALRTAAGAIGGRRAQLDSGAASASAGPAAAARAGVLPLARPAAEGLCGARAQTPCARRRPERRRAHGVCVAAGDARPGRACAVIRGSNGRKWRCPPFSRTTCRRWSARFALAAVFSAELSTADAVLVMLATSGARDFYRGFVRPSAGDAEVLRVARVLALVGCVVGYLLTFVFDSVVSALTMFYSVMVVTLFAPILGALLLPKAGGSSALAAMLVGVATLFTVHMVTGGAGYGWVSPSFLGMLASGLTYLILAVF